jgi:sugar-specific transcriptional regulator TrmB
MLGDTEIFDTLKSIGLNLYERKIFVALLAKGIATAAEVSEMASVPRSRSYDVLESLAEKGFIIVQPSKPIKYVALKPREAVERVKENLTKRHETMIERIEKLKDSDVLEKLEQMFQEGFNHLKPSEMTGTLKGRHVIDRQMRSVFRQAKESINIATTEQGLEELYSKHFRFLKKANHEGVKLNIIAPLRNPDVVKSLSEIAELKNTEKNLGRFCIVDNKYLLMALTDDKKTHETQDIMFWADSPHAVESVVGNLFLNEWGSEKDVQ